MPRKIRLLHKGTIHTGNEDGSVIVATLLILVLLTIVGIASTNVSNNEVQIAGHTAAYQQNFYRAEGATIEAIDLLEAVANPKLNPPSWLEPNLDTVTNTNIQDLDFWKTGTGTVDAADSNLENTQYVAVSEGIVSGNSLNMGSSTIHGYIIYGRCSPPRRGATVVQIGYLKAF